MKKFYSFALILLTLFSCVVFSACGDKYKKLKMDIVSSEGESLEEINYTLDQSIENKSVRVGIEFSNIDEEDVGQIVVYSLPSELISVTNYIYDGKNVYVDFTPIAVSDESAKFVVSHLDSGKKKEIPLKIGQKSQSLSISNTKYIISIPDSDSEKFVDLSKVVNLIPATSTDKVFFKVKENIKNIETIQTEELKSLSGYSDDCYSGFKVPSTIEDGTIVKIYPVTYMEGYVRPESDLYIDKIIEVHFKRTLNENNVEVKSMVEGVDVNDIKLIANDDNLKSLKLNLFYLEENTKLIETDFFNMYEIDFEVDEENLKKISTFTDGNKNIIVTANAYLEKPVELKIRLKPINYVGEIEKVELTVKIKSELKSETIKVFKEGKEISLVETAEIFDYYKDSNVVGTLFNFVPYSRFGDVFDGLTNMQITINPSILNADKNSSDNTLNVVYEDNTFEVKSDKNTYETVEVKSNRYVLSIFKFKEPLKFYYDENLNKMVSETITSTDKIYIKYLENDLSKPEASDFGITVHTINNSEIDYWADLAPTSVNIKLNRVKGVKEMTLKAGYYIDSAQGNYKLYDKDVKSIYLNRNKDGLDKCDYTEIHPLYFVKVNTALDREGKTISTTILDVSVKLKDENKVVTNPLTIYDHTKDEGVIKNTNGVDELVFSFDSSKLYNVLSFVFDQNTSIGEYVITFSQGSTKLASISCKVYETIDDETFTDDMVLIETNDKAFKNTDYTEIYDANYIVAVGQNLDISIDLPDDVLNSGMVVGYKFEFNIGDVDVAEDYMEFAHDDSKSSDNIAKFKKGTVVDGEKKYISLMVSIECLTYSDIVTPSENKPYSKTFTFFVYEEIQKENISINHKNLTKQRDVFTGAYYKELSSTNLDVTLTGSLLWDYTTGENKVDWFVNNVKLTLDGSDYLDGINIQPSGDEKSCGFTFTDTGTYVIKAIVYQFKNMFEVQCVVKVIEPVLTESLIVESELSITDDENQSYYINLKLGEEYQMKAQNVSRFGMVTNPEIVIQVADKFGTTYGIENYFDIDEETSTIKVKAIDEGASFKLVVFAKDAMKAKTSGNSSGYDRPINFMIDDSRVTNNYSFSNAYLVIDIVLSNGTETNPYLIQTSEDFWQIDDTDDYRSSKTYWELRTSVFVNNANNKISKFAGNLRTYNNNIYLINGIVLNAENKNLFENFSGNVSNVNFVVRYDYKIESNSDEFLGVFNKNSGTLTNVSVEISGKANFNGGGTYYFGGLVGENKNKIQYENGVGVLGTIDISGNSKVYFGGLVGKNVKEIVGCESSTMTGGTNEIIVSGSTGRTNAMSLIKINSTLENGSAIGGVVGLNTYGVDTTGTIKNAFVQATIDAETTSNVGGVIGENKQKSSGITIANSTYTATPLTSDDAIAYNVKSASTIKANDNVGGIVGLDVNGVYVECDYQVYSSQNATTAQITGNIGVGGISGYSDSGKFVFCSVMSYRWDYKQLKTDSSKVVLSNIADIHGIDYVGGIVGKTFSSAETFNISSPTLVENRVVIAYSSVNAYLSSTNNIGGIHSSKTGSSILYSVYFIGKLEGNVIYKEQTVGDIQYFALDNNRSSIFNVAYSLNVDSTLKSGAIDDGSNFYINTITTEPYWWHNESINGGYIFVTTDATGSSSSLPIFDLAPEDITVVVNGETVEELKQVLRLYYYDFMINENITNDELLVLNEEYNRNKYVYKADGSGLLNISTKPDNIGSVVVNVRSTNTTILDVTVDGKLLVYGVGECDLVVSSALNPGVYETIRVIIDYPVDNFKIRSNSNIVEQGSQENISKDSSVHYNVVTSGSVNVTNPDATTSNYLYKTKTDTNLEIKILYNGNINIEEYVQISGMNGLLTKDTTSTLVVNLENSTPLIISILKQLESSSFDVSIKPYRIINGKRVYYKNGNDDIKLSFILSTMEGVTGIAFSYDDAIVYPNDTVYVNAYLKTDKQVDPFERLSFSIAGDYKLSNSYSNYTITNGSGAEVGSFKIFKEDSDPFDKNNELQTIKFRIEFSEFNLTEEIFLQLKYFLQNGDYDSVNFSVLPQRINKIEIKNYYNDNGTWEQLDVLKPSDFGKLIIDIVPDNGYYDYLEISDVTGNEEIVFIQVDEDGTALSLKFDPSSDNKGIKLYGNSLDMSRVFVRTQIDRNYSSKMHTIQVRAYSSNGTLIAKFNKNVEVKMLPEITVDYLRPDGGTDISVDTSENGTRYLANGVDANFRIITKNVNREIEFKIEGDLANKYEIVNIASDYYTLKLKEGQAVDADDINKKVKVTFNAYSYMDIGDYDVAECSIEFTIASFVIHGVSVNNSIDNSSKTEIYGYFGKAINLNFYFDKDDISYHDINSTGDKFWDTEYVYDLEYKTRYDINSIDYQIQSVLEGLNSFDADGNNQYLILNNNTKDDSDSNKYKELDTSEISNITLANNKLFVEEGYSPEYLATMFKMNYNKAGKSWGIVTYGTTTSSDGSYFVDKNYKLNFINATEWFEPTVINSKEDFEKMTSGGRYILNVDLVDDPTKNVYNALRNYTPIDADLVEFDGNGHTIEIQSFNKFNDVSLRAGLFRQIYENMIVKNVKVKYNSIEENGEWTLGQVGNSGITYYDLCNNAKEVNYTDAKFGGITAINKGVITNCVVEGRVALSASILEQKSVSSGGSYQIDFNIGGMVAENTSTGYITNSISELDIYSQSNIGGFVHSNAGKIVSSGVEKETTIYGYNLKLGNTINIEIGGFAVTNTGEISMSYVELLTGMMSAKDISAGFVYTNNGTIYDSYVKMAQTGVNNNKFAGFVYSNSGIISRAYTHINSGVLASKDDSMFVSRNIGTIIDSIEFLTNNATSAIEGLSSIDVTNSGNKAIYEANHFAFGDNVSAVWSIQLGGTPELVSTKELLFKDFAKLSIYLAEDSDPNDGVDEKNFKTNYAQYGTKNNPYIIHDLTSWNNFFDENLTYLTGYYRIVKDISFASTGDNPSTSATTFSGNIQGNNMKLDKILLYSNETLDSIGLFEKLEGVKDISVVNSVRNLKINTTSVWASSTSAVGILAGIIEDFNIYNITIDAENVIMVGGNAVGGLAGIIRGDFDVDQISSNISANSTRASALSNYSIYASRNNRKAISYNLMNVYYAGSVVGILDGYDKGNFNINIEPRNIETGYFMVRNITVNGNIVLTGDTVGSAFGLVGERVYVKYLNINIEGSIFGSEYSAGAVGENRGVINNAKITLADNLFKKSKYVSAGAVGFNLGGLVMNVEVTAKINKTEYAHIVGGIIGRNIYGTATKAHFAGELYSYFTGGIVGVNYDHTILVNTTTGSGAIDVECKTNKYLIPNGQVEYKENNEAITNFEEVSLSKDTLEYLVDNSIKYYTYETYLYDHDGNSSTDPVYTTTFVKNRVLGLVVGLSYEPSLVGKTDKNSSSTASTDDDTFNICLNKDKIIFNCETDKIEGVNYYSNLKASDLYGVSCGVYFENINTIDLIKDKSYLIFLVGAEATSFDSWQNYSEDFIFVR